jgi:two-component system, sensor histidine kinase and response regulator
MKEQVNKLQNDGLEGTLPIKVLVVDDDEVDRMAVLRAFKEADFSVELFEALDCAEAINLAGSQAFDCIFVDYRLPDGNGIDLIRQLRKQGIVVPIVTLTGQSNDQVAVELMKAGASDYLSKSKVSGGRLQQVFQNVMRVYQAEAAAALAHRQREELLQQKEEVMSRLTHDLQTPLVAANRMLELVGEQAFGPVSEEIKRRLNVVVGSNEDMIRMVRNILEAYTYDIEGKHFSFIPFKMTDLAEEIHQQLNPLAIAKNLVFTVEQALIQPQLASFDLLADRLEIKRLLTNLVGNSLKFTDSGWVTLGLTPATPDLPWILIQVEDSGSGIAPSDLSCLFERFRRGTHRRSNSGLGLYLCRQIIEGHGGVISVESALGRGSTFTVKLPVKPRT